MTDFDNYNALEINGERIGLQEVIRLAKSDGRATFVKDAADAVLVRQEARKLGICVNDQELQSAADRFRTSRELYDAKATEQWLAANYLSHAEWEALLEDEVIRFKVCDFITNHAVERYFAEQRLSFDGVTVSRLLVKEQSVAKELKAQIVEDGADFHSLARQYSIDYATKFAGGYAGFLRRTAMQPEVEAAIFGAQPGTTIGPIETRCGWQLLKLESLHVAILDDPMREEIKSILFENWLNGQRLKAKIRVMLWAA
jgi:parvulin-like peptidyl-prolyl isomerase